ncbi:MAG TPA: hypothetical protein VFT12_10180, partial [Thermoanaerobaculia bacterium]|nr:hypothetical protein [Thermoanaerobaculia bacterium]
LRYGKLPPVASSTTVGSLQQQAIGLIASYIEIYGSVTYGGEPIGEDAELRFPGGYGFVPGKTSEYRAVLLGLLGPETHVAVAACDGAPRETVLTDRQTRPNTRFNIDIPANELVISVTDTFTREPLNDATIRLTAMAVLRPNRPVFTKTVTASGEQGEGRVRIEAVPERLIRLSVASAGYQRQEIEPFTMPRSGTKAVDVQLVPLRGSQGRILSSRTFENASVLWFSEEGYETERAELSADGTFVHARSHDAGERMVVVSQSHPLWVLRPPPVERRQAISLAFPDAAPVRTVEAKLADAEEPNRVAGLVLGGIRVPQPALQQHQALRRDRTTVSGRAPIILRDLVATGPIEILLGPRYEELSSRAAGMDFFALPQFADVPRTTIPAEATVVVLRP